MANKKPKKQYPLTLHGKRINNFFKSEVKRTAKKIKVDVSTPYKLKKFWDKHKQTFDNLFSTGTETIEVGTTTIFNEINKKAKLNHEFYYKENDIEIDAKPLDIKFQLAKTEQLCNSLLGSTGFIYSYKTTYDGKEIFELPTEEEIEMLTNESVEFAVDYLSNYGIKLFTSDKANKNYATNEQRRKRYNERTEEKFNAIKTEWIAERNRNEEEKNKVKTKRQKRK